MKNSLYKIIMFILQVITIILLIILCLNSKAFNCFNEIILIDEIKKLINNNYFINIICSVITVLILYVFQIKYCKKKIKEDFRCNEIIVEIYDGLLKINKLIELANSAKKDCEKLNMRKNQEAEDYLEKRKKKAKIYYDFYASHIVDFDFCNLILTYENNNILIDSVQSVFFINLNFKLLNIINNIKNRKPNITKGFTEITDLYAKYKNAKNEKDLIRCGETIEHYIDDINFMSKYVFNLLKYLNYDPIPAKLFGKYFNENYPTNNDFLDYFNLPFREQNKISTKIMRRVKKTIFVNMVITFFHKDK